MHKLLLSLNVQKILDLVKAFKRYKQNVDWPPLFWTTRYTCAASSNVTCQKYCTNLAKNSPWSSFHESQGVLMGFRLIWEAKYLSNRFRWLCKNGAQFLTEVINLSVMSVTDIINRY